MKQQLFYRYLQYFFCTVFVFLLTANVRAEDVSTATQVTAPTPLPSTAGNPPIQPVMLPTPPPLEASSYILLDSENGQVLASKNAEQRMPPASLTKIMTMYLVSDALKHGRLHLNDLVRISEKAWRTGGSRMFLRVGESVPVQDLIKGIIIVSGNDASVAMAEHLAGSEEAFAEMMNHQAQVLGMKNTHFTDSTGMPAPEHYTTAADMAILARALIKNFPDFYQWYSQRQFSFNNIEQYNRNRLLWMDPSVDGVKTGHTESAGYCLVASAKKGDMRLISVIMNAPSANQRSEDSLRLITYGFRFFTGQHLYKKGQALANPRIWYSEKKHISVGLNQDLYVSVPTSQHKNLKANLMLPRVIKAPLVANQEVGKVRVMLNDKLLMEHPIVALENTPKGGMWQRMRDSFSLFFDRWLGDDETTTDLKEHA